MFAFLVIFFVMHYRLNCYVCLFVFANSLFALAFVFRVLFLRSYVFKYVLVCLHYAYSSNANLRHCFYLRLFCMYYAYILNKHHQLSLTYRFLHSLSIVYAFCCFSSDIHFDVFFMYFYSSSTIWDYTYD